MFEARVVETSGGMGALQGPSKIRELEECHGPAGARRTSRHMDPWTVRYYTLCRLELAYRHARAGSLVEASESCSPVRCSER